MRSDEWFVAVRDALSDTDLVDYSIIEAEEAKLPQLPVVSLFGAYDAGKSTLLKRLLVEAGVDVPSWLTVSARRETFEANDVEAYGCILRDTPGIAAGSQEHEAFARNAVLGSDVMLLVMPPQLLTGDKATVLQLLSGTAFRKQGLASPASLLVAIAKLDERADPIDDLSGYQNYANLKRNEWSKLLTEEKLPLTSASVFALSADPFGDVGNDDAPTPDDYRGGCRAWDGVGDLVLALEALPTQLSELRRSAQIRRLCFTMTQCLEKLTHQRAGMELARAEAEQQGKWGKEFSSRKALQQQVAQDELSRNVEEQITSFNTTQSTDVEVLRQRLQRVFEAWLSRQRGDLSKLIEESNAELIERPSEELKISDWIEKSAALDEDFKLYKIISPKKIEVSAKESLKNLKKNNFFGRSLSKIEKDVIKFRLSTNYEALKKAERELRNYKAKLFLADAALASMPILIDLGGMFFDNLVRANKAEASAKERAERQKQIEDFCHQISQEAWDHLAPEFEAYQDWLDEKMKHADEAVRGIEEEQEVIGRQIYALLSLLEEAPVNSSALATALP